MVVALFMQVIIKSVAGKVNLQGEKKRPALKTAAFNE